MIDKEKAVELIDIGIGQGLAAVFVNLLAQKQGGASASLVEEHVRDVVRNMFRIREIAIDEAERAETAGS